MTIVNQTQAKNKSRRPQRYWIIWNDGSDDLMSRIKDILQQANIKSNLGYSNKGNVGLRIAATRRKALSVIMQSDALRIPGSYFVCDSDEPGERYDIYSYVLDEPGIDMDEVYGPVAA